MKTERRRVLVVDGHEDVLMLLERLLEDCGYDTTTTWTGKEALAAASGTVFDLILMNEYLPDMDAEDFIPALRHRAICAPCVVMEPSAVDISNTAQFLAAGAVAVVCKWSHAKVVEAVRAQLTPSAGARRSGGQLPA